MGREPDFKTYGHGSKHEVLGCAKAEQAFSLSLYIVGYKQLKKNNVHSITHQFSQFADESIAATLESINLRGPEVRWP